jgi:hypothetical protein
LVYWWAFVISSPDCNQVTFVTTIVVAGALGDASCEPAARSAAT